MLAIEMANVHKRYYRSHALRGVNLQMEPGKIVGLLGPNGAGKSTLLKICAGLAHPTTGRVHVLGRDVSTATKGLTAFVPENDTFYSWMTPRQAVAFENSMFSDMDVSDAMDLLRELRLDPDNKISSLSKGQRGRLKLVLAMSRRARVVLMDEPLAGIDPPSRAAILETIASRYRAGEQTIIISTHEVLESEKLFEDVVFLSDGQIVLSGNADELRANRSKSLNEIFAEVC
ncbi:MAG TPA: multidrug ABC transporter ATP-binding protein [Firmicutes bacterium]|jgi:ABC-2 type transport system ATP-binding protein|nr:multidrug ABC transporter ATP-binding protein [Bacillota bacterium]HBK60996.1 multidrug ABC transporter ATP-binding protein [Bacillota bacterium]